MKIYIVGTVSSGKTTLAKRLSQISAIPYYSLDELVYFSDKSNKPWGNREREAEERNKMFHSIIGQRDWIIEDIGRPCFEEGLKEADTIVLLEISSKIRTYRIIKRWIKQLLGIEKCIYTPGFVALKCMLQSSREYDAGIDNLKERISPYQGKIIVLRNNKEINAFLEGCIKSPTTA